MNLLQPSLVPFRTFSRNHCPNREASGRSTYKAQLNTMSTNILAILVLVAAVQQAIVPFFVRPFRRGHNAIRETSRTHIQPAGYAFAIWGPIYLLALLFAIWQVLPQNGGTNLQAQMAPLAIALYLGSSIWLWLATTTLVWLTIPLLALMAGCAIWALYLAAGSQIVEPSWYFFAVLPFGLYAGWTTCATFVNIASVAPRLGFDGTGMSQLALDLICLAGASIVGIVVLWFTDGEIGFAATILWALFAIIVTNKQNRGPQEVYFGAIASSALVVAATVWLNASSF